MMAMLLVGYIVGGKRVAAEALVVLQVAYASLLTVPKISPMFVGLEPLSVAGNGINMLYDPYLRPFEDVLSD